MIDTIVFDLGGVLIDWNPRYVYREIFKDDGKMEWFLANICTGEWNAEQDRGRTMAEGTAVLKKAYPEYGELIDLFYDRWDEMLNGEIPDSAAILSELKKSYKLFALTNWSAETFHIALERFPFLQMFEGIVVSGVEKMLKPDKRLFKALLDRFALKAEQCVYVDDTKRNVEVANELGFHAIHFISAADFKRKMESLNLLK